MMNKFSINNNKVLLLTNLCKNILKGNTKKEIIKRTLENAGVITPLETISVLETIIVSSVDIAEKKKNIAKVLNILNEGLRKYQWEPGIGNRFLRDMIAENREAEKRLKEIKTELKNFLKENGNDTVLTGDIGSLLDMILGLSQLGNHYRKKENILFPYMEKRGGDLSCLPVMWSIHDDVRSHLKELSKIRSLDEIKIRNFNKIVGELFFSVYAMIFRENLILFPAADQILTSEEWEQMYTESLDIGFSFIEPESKSPKNDNRKKDTNKVSVELSTGTLDIEALELIINTIPLDITYIDEDNKVTYFSQPVDRIFTRSKAVLGRDVRNCHPPKSLDKVNSIIESFRKGTSDKESFRIYYNDRYILIEYYAVRNKNREYKGVLEVTMDITDIREMDGEKRL